MSSALASTKDVYGIRRLSFDHAARTLRVEYDATRLNAASVAKLVRQAGLDIDLAAADPPCSRLNSRLRLSDAVNCAGP